MKAVHVAVVDERYVFRRGVIACLSDDATLRVIHESDGGDMPRDIDVVVASGRVARSRSWDVPVVVCVQRDDPRLFERDDVMAVLEIAGLGVEELQGAVRAAAVGLAVRRSSPVERHIDGRMLAVLNLLAEGAQTRDISSELGFSERTIKNDIRDISERLQARTRTQAVALAIRMGLI